jgi:hypothetical protein
VNAIRVRKRSKSGGITYHWLLDPGRTYCGKHVDALQVDETLELERLPSVEACLQCERFRDGWTKPERAEGEQRVIAPPSHGRLRTTGPLSHGTRPRQGRRL